MEIMEAKKIVSDYKTLCAEIADIVESSGFKIDFVCDKIGLSRMGFYKKRKTGTFKPDELAKLLQIIDVANK